MVFSAFNVTPYICVDSHKKRLTACVPHGIISTCVGMSHGICHTVRRDLP